jgi:hypothetical protein
VNEFTRLERFKCKETQNCDGEQEVFLRGIFDGKHVMQSKCNKCFNYVRIVDGNFYSAGKYNGVDRMER